MDTGTRGVRDTGHFSGETVPAAAFSYCPVTGIVFCANVEKQRGKRKNSQPLRVSGGSAGRSVGRTAVPDTPDGVKQEGGYSDPHRIQHQIVEIKAAIHKRLDVFNQQRCQDS